MISVLALGPRCLGSPSKISCLGYGLALALLLLSWPGSASAAPSPSAAPEGSPPLVTQKLEAEVAKVRDEAHRIEQHEGVVGRIVELAPLVTALVALGGLIATVWKQMAETSRQRQLDREEWAKERRRHFDDQFQRIAENLSSEREEVRAAAAASIEMFMQPEYEDLHHRLFLLLLGALRFPRRDISDKILVRTFQQIAPRQIRSLRRHGSLGSLDLSNCYLAFATLRAVDLDEADIAFTDLHGADLSKSALQRARGYQVDLSGSRLDDADLQEARLVRARVIKARLRKAKLVSTKLQHADATGANFRGASMQEVQLDHAILRGAHFEGTNLNNAFFRGAIFDEGSLRSIARGALNWRDANWDPEIFARLRDISAGVDS